MKPPARIATIRQSPRTSTKYVSLVNPNAGMIGMAFPGTFIVDRYGRVTSRFFEEFYRDRHTASSLMMALGGRAGAVTGAQSPEARAAQRRADRLTLTGALNYLACDDNVCFSPISFRSRGHECCSRLSPSDRSERRSKLVVLSPVLRMGHPPRASSPSGPRPRVSVISGTRPET